MALYHTTKGPVDYTVVGNPTIVDGIASGFSDSDYLTLDLPFNPKSNDFEIVFSLTTGNTLRSEDFFFTSVFEGTNSIGIRLGQYAGKLFWTAGVSNSGAQIPNSSILNPEENPDYVNPYLQTNTSYKIKYTFSHSGEACIYLLVNNEWVWVVRGNFGSDYSGVDFVTSTIGRWINSNYLGHYWKGHIDLNETYIKVNRQPWFGLCPVEVQKHRLKGPVGYTVVGSPTIVDGIASGFSGSNYLRTSENFLKTYTDFEIVCRAKPAPAGSGLICQGNGAEGNWTFILSPSTVIMVPGTYANRLQISNLGLDTTKFYYIRYLLKNSIATISLSEDGVVYNQIGSMTMDLSGLTSNTYLVFGHNTNYGSSFSGSIDLNHTYIKVNGKLWFYQPADTKYIVKDGKLVWADPNIYLQSTGTQKIDTGLIRNGTNDNYRFVTSISYQDNQARQLNGSHGFMYFGALYGRYQITNPGSNYENVVCPRDKFVNVDVFFDCPNQACSYTVGSTSRSFTLPEDGLYSSVTAAIYLFNITNNNFPCWCKMKPFKIYKNGILVRDFVPVPTGLVIGNFTVPSNGMFDIVNQHFYANQGTGEFAIGRDE